MRVKGRGLGQVATLGLVTVLIGFVGERDKFTFGRSPAELTGDLIGIFPTHIFHTALFMTEFTIFSLKPIEKSL